MPTAYEILQTMYDNRHTKEEVVQEVWDTPTSSLSTLGTIGNYISTKLLTVSKFLGLK